MSNGDEKRYWQSPNEPDPDRAGPANGDPKPLGRRGFFQVMGLSTAAFAAACKRAPEMKLVPFLEHPPGLVPGVSRWYASTCGGCSAACGLLVKSRDGRPIKVEGNPEHPWSAGGVCAVGQASVLGLYDAGRGRHPSGGGAKITWARLDQAVSQGLARAAASGRSIAVVTPRELGPGEEAALAELLRAFPTAQRVIFEPLGHEAILAAHELTHGAAQIPTYRFDRAARIVSFGADFLGTWLSPVAFTRQYAQGRKPEDPAGMSRHVQIEGPMSLTGSNADHRIPLPPSRYQAALVALAQHLAKRAPGLDPALAAKLAGAPSSPLPKGKLRWLARELWGARGRALVVCDSTDRATQVVVNTVNALLGAYGATIELGTRRAQPARSFSDFEKDLGAGRVEVVILYGVNPVYAHPAGERIATALAKVPLSVAVAERADETARTARYHAPSHHYLEDWADASPRTDVLSLRQPLLRPLYRTRSAPESLLRWAGKTDSFLSFLQARWEREVFPHAALRLTSFKAFWDRSVHDGFARVQPQPGPLPSFRGAGAAAAWPSPTAKTPAGYELSLYEKVALRDGRAANNAWLQELPDPISKVTWGNYAGLAPRTARRLGLREGDVVSLEVGGRGIELPVLHQPGLPATVVAVAVGYGREHAGRIGDRVGANVYRLAAAAGLGLSRWRAGLKIRRTGRREHLAMSQTHHSMEGRPLVREANLPQFRHDPRAGNPGHAAKSLSLWPKHEYKGYRWGMAIDLSKCTGCSACVVACQAENNIAVVGKDEVWRRREMHWLRIDRYYNGSADAPQVVHQPMLCLHCENAPCETVCPVLATVHSSEGLNQQIYARCVGTRYCANNCPIKTRRFNWFDYDRSDATANMVLNPDVTVRVRGVMEKCSLCVQRIQAGKALARTEGRTVRDGDILPACQQSCPADAIVFGDLNDPKSALSALVKRGRHYTILEEVNIQPVVGYLTRIRNRAEEEA